VASWCFFLESWSCLDTAVKETDVTYQIIATHADVLCGIVTARSLAYECRFFLPPSSGSNLKT
jgi:hypothetical protein